MAMIPNLPDGWTQSAGATYAKALLSFSEVLSVFAEPGVDDVPIEFGGEGFTVAEAEELVRRLAEAIAIAKGGGAS